MESDFEPLDGDEAFKSYARFTPAIDLAQSASSPTSPSSSTASAGEISAAGVRTRVSGYSEDDAMTPEEFFKWSNDCDEDDERSTVSAADYFGEDSVKNEAEDLKITMREFKNNFEWEYNTTDRGTIITQLNDVGNKENMLELIIPQTLGGKPVIEIGEGVFFNGMVNFSSVIIPEGVTKIGAWAFSECEELADVKIPEGVTEIGEDAFSDCKALAKVLLPNSMRVIGAYAFDTCTSLIDVTIPEGVEKLGAYAFSGCISLSSVIIPDSIREIGEKAFSFCTRLVNISMPGRFKNTCLEEYGLSGKPVTFRE